MKSLIAFGLFLLALMSPLSLATAQEVVCAPADKMRGFLESQNFRRTAMGELSDGDHFEAWERADRIVFVILTPSPVEPSRCIVGEVGVNRAGREA